MPTSTAPPLGPIPPPHPVIAEFGLDPALCFLNHGSFGSTPLAVRAEQERIRARMEREPIRFFVEDLEPLLDEARALLAPFVGCDPEDFSFAANATAAVNTVVNALRFAPGDEILTSTHEYNACSNALRTAAARWGATVVAPALPFPVASPVEYEHALLSAITSRTRLLLLSHITSPTGLILPVERIVRAAAARGVETLVDGAHAPAFLPLNVRSIGCGYYTGNFHKWLCAPKGSAFLYVRRDLQPRIHPLIVSHGANATRPNRSRFRLEFDYIGSLDYSPWIATPAALRFGVDLARALGVNAQTPHEAWSGLMSRNRALALAGRDLLCRAMGTPPVAPDEMLGCMAAVRIHPRRDHEQVPTLHHDALQDRLIDRHHIQVPVIPFPAPPERHVRISAAPYNTIEQYEYLARALRAERDALS
ncbi:MAG: aminotransferase class V-fold PLP-dependent enzyme [Phycisphaerales bacterium]